jgi:type II secretory pathway component GspD/PulD (secretin)/tetratricopeptide (TPR) repeat protein
MSPSTHLSVKTLLAAACAFAGVSTTTLIAAPASHAEPTADVRDTTKVLDRAVDMINDGKLIQGRAMLLALQDSPAGASLGDAESQRLWEQLAGVERKIRQADRLDIFIQKAELALTTDNLVEAERQANAVKKSAKSTSEQLGSADAVLGLVQLRRDEVSPLMGNAISNITAAFNAGDYAKAKTIVERVGRIGADLTTEQTRTLAKYRHRLADLEKSGSFTSAQMNPAMGMLAPESGLTSEWLTGSTNELPQDSGRSGSYAAQPEDVPVYEPIEVELVDLVPNETNSVSDENTNNTFVQDNTPVDLLDTARQFEAQSLLGEANRAYEERRLGDALSKYTQVLDQYGSYLSAADRSMAQQRRTDIQIQTGASGGPEDGLLDDTIEDQGLQLQRAEATFSNLMQQANAALTSGDTNSARNLAAQASLTVGRARNVMSESRYEQLMGEIDALVSTINAEEENIRIRTAQEEEAERLAQTQELEATRRSERDNKIIESINRVRALQQELKYEEALEVVNSILFLDPHNPSGLLLKDIIEDTIIYREYLGYVRERKMSYVEQNLQNEEAAIAPETIVGYPSDWPSISFRRGDALEFAESEANQAVLATLEDTRMPVEFADNAFEDVVAFIGATTNIDIDVDWDSLAEIGVDPDSPVDLTLKNVTVATLLDRVIAKVSDPDLPAGWAIMDGILTIASDEVLRKNTVLEIYDIRDLIFEVPNFDNAPQFNLQSAIQSASGGGGGGGQSPFSQGGQDVDLVDRDDRIQQIVDLLQANIDPDGWADLGGDTSAITELNGNFVITSTPKNHRAIIGLLNKLREKQAMQINVETRFLLVSQDFFEQIGFDLDMYFNANSTEFQLARVVDPSLLPSDYFGEDGRLLDNVSGGGFFFDSDGDGIVDTPVTQPVISPGGNGGTLPDGTVLGPDYWSIISGEQDSFGLTNALAAGSSFANTVLNINPALSVSGRFLDDIQVDFLVEATQADRRSVSLTAPRLTFTNGQRAYITVATTTSFVSDLTPIASDSSVAFDPQIATISAGVLVDVNGVVSADRRYVTITIRTSQSAFEFDSDNNISVTGAAGGGGVGGGNAGVAVGTIQVPLVTTTDLRTTVTIPDQGTVLLGGQRILEELEVETGVPVLSKIPILSRFFSNRLDTKEEKTLLVLLKPTILIQSEEEERNYPGLLDQLGG